MAGAGDWLQFGSRRDKRERSYHLVDGTEAIVRTVHEERRDLEAWEVCRAQLTGSLRRVERV